MEKLIIELIRRFEKLETEVRMIRRELGTVRALPARMQEPALNANLSEMNPLEPKRDREYYSQLLAKSLIDMGYSGG